MMRSDIDASIPSWLEHGGRMAHKISAFDWSQTSLGEMANWPVALRSVVKMALLSQQPICLFWGNDLIMLYNDAYAPILGQKESVALGQKFAEIWADVWDDVKPIVDKALSGQGTWIEDLPLTMTRNGFEEETFWSFSYSPLYDDTGRISGMINITTDTTQAVLGRRALAANVERAQQQLDAQIKLDAQQRDIQREMSHRIKNILSMTMAVVSQTLRHSVSLEEATKTVSTRISALSDAQDLLIDAQSSHADLGHLVRRALHPYQEAEPRIAIDGPEIKVPAQHALGVALAMNELATNALKYGALSGMSGRVEVNWTIGADNAFAMEWKEMGGPEVVPPARSGFGSRLMGKIVPGYFAGSAQTHYHPEGVHYVLHGTIDPNLENVSEPLSGDGLPDR